MDYNIKMSRVIWILMAKKIVILFTELSGYMLKCFDLAQKDNFQIHVINYPVNKEAPFQFIKP